MFTVSMTSGLIYYQYYNLSAIFGLIIFYHNINSLVSSAFKIILLNNLIENVTEQ